jgi:hypothetical protein
MSEISKAVDVVSSDIAASRSPAEFASAAGVYSFKCYDADGNLKWEEVAPNKVMIGGVSDMNTKYFTGSAYTAAWYLGLISGAGGSNVFNFTDTMASHPNWTEGTGYSQSTHPACTFASGTSANPSVATNSASTATFSINTGATISGAFLTSNNAKSATTGILFSAGNFTGGDRTVVNGDTLVVTYTFSLTAT